MKNPKIGPTGKFPEGKLNPTDEGEIVFGVARDPKTGLVHLKFGTPVAWVAIAPEIAVNLARNLLKHAGASKVTIEFGGSDGS